MEILSHDQSAFLKRLSEGSLSYEPLTNDEKAVCDFLIKRGYVDGRYLRRSSSDGFAFRSWEELDTVSISEGGKVYLINEKLSVDERIYIQDELNAMQNLANASQRQARLAEETAETAKKDALFSKVVSIVAIVISVAAIVVPLFFTV